MNMLHIHVYILQAFHSWPSVWLLFGKTWKYSEARRGIEANWIKLMYTIPSRLLCYVVWRPDSDVMSLRSALHIAALRGNVNVMRMLLETRCLNCRPTESSSCSKYPKATSFCLILMLWHVCAEVRWREDAKMSRKEGAKTCLSANNLLHLRNKSQHDERSRLGSFHCRPKEMQLPSIPKQLHPFTIPSKFLFQGHIMGTALQGINYVYSRWDDNLMGLSEIDNSIEIKTW